LKLCENLRVASLKLCENLRVASFKCSVCATKATGLSHDERSSQEPCGAGHQVQPEVPGTRVHELAGALYVSTTRQVASAI
jgi:hypothetical protein